jgi:uncharacterized membrane protein YphA (DoxX/SURF4 family)
MTAFIYFSTRTVLASTLVGAAAAKLGTFRGFRRSLATMKWVPFRSDRLNGGLAVVIALTELAVGSLSLLGVAQSLLDGVVCAVMVTFLVVTVYALATRPGVPCRCFGALSDSNVTTASVARNGGLVALALSALVLPDKHLLYTPTERSLIAAALLVVALATAQAASALEISRRRRTT